MTLFAQCGHGLHRNIDLGKRSGGSLALLGSWEGDAAAVHALAFAAGGTRLVSGGDDQQVHVWSLPDGKSVKSAHVGGRIRALAVSPDGTRLAVATWLPGDAEITLYEMGPLD